MSYKALYRSYRPTNFGEVIGQRHVIQTLKNALKEDKISHAYAFCGLRGIGKTTVARILAKAVNCLNLNNGEPCNECANCKAIDENTTTDIVELDAASNNGVDEIRSILDKVNFLPSALKKKVYIIDEVHMLSTAAFNALLKTLEEPPAYVMFILATTEPHKIPLTILSRCQRFDFKQLTLEELTVEIELICEKEHINISDEAVSKIAEAAEGGMRDALSILDQASVYANENVTTEDVDAVTGNVSNNKLIELIKALNNDDATLSINIVNELLNMGKEVTRLITNVVQFARDLLLFKSVDPTEFNKAIYKNEEFKALALESDANRLFYYIDVLVDVQNKIRFTNSQKIYLEVGIMKIISRANEDIDILGRIKDLEEKLNNGGTSTDFAGNPNVEQKILIMDNKIKKISTDLERMDIKGFKELILSKINVLEDVTSNASTIPLIQDRLSIIENRFNELEFGGSSNNNPQSNNENVYKLIDDAKAEFEKNINSLRQELQQSGQSNNYQPVNNLEDINKRIDELEELVLSFPKQDNQVVRSNPFEQDILLDIENLKKQVNELKENKSIQSTDNSDIFENENELSMPTKRVNPYRIMDEETSISDKSLEDIYSKYDSLVRDIENLRSNPVNLYPLEEKIRQLEEKINNSDNASLAQNLAELKTNYFLLSQTVEYMGNKKVETVDNSELINRLNKLENDLSLLYKEIDNKKVTYVSNETKVSNESKAFNEPKIAEEPVEEAPIVEQVVEKPAYVEEKPLVEEVKEESIVEDTEEVDLTEKIYDVKILNNILNEAFDKSLKQEKETLMANWGSIEDKATGLNASTARLLASGSLKACGKDKILIIYPTAQMCNELMTPGKHEEARNILKATFNKDYDFFALPDDIWMEKRMEYYNQRSVGNIPNLTPFNNPQLKIIQPAKQSSLSERERIISKAEEFFGDE